MLFGSAFCKKKEDDHIKQATFTFRNAGDVNTLGTWWWRSRTMLGDEGEDRLRFLRDNGVSEIYLACGRLSPAEIAQMIRLSGAYGMRVAWLDGDYPWILPGHPHPFAVVDAYLAYQRQAAPEERFYALHLDVEPHQHPEFNEKTDVVLQWFADYMREVSHRIHAAGETLEWDIPFWLHRHMVTDENGNSVNLAAYAMTLCDALGVMAYRDSAKAMLQAAQENIPLAQSSGCKLIVGAETYSNEGAFVSFHGKGTRYMAKELAWLNDRLRESFPDRRFGLAVHCADRWYGLPEEPYDA